MDRDGPADHAGCLGPATDAQPNLCSSLKNGIILCHLAKTIDDSFIPVIHDSTNYYKMRENLKMFIEVCHELHLPLFSIPSCEDFDQNVALAPADPQKLVRIVDCLYLFIRECIKNYELPPFPVITLDEIKARPLPPAAEVDALNDQLRLQPKSVIGGNIRISATVFKTTLQYLMSNTKGFDINVYEATIARAQASPSLRASQTPSPSTNRI